MCGSVGLVVQQFIATLLQWMDPFLGGRVIVISTTMSRRVRRRCSCGAACHRNATAVVGRTSERARGQRLCNDDRRVCGSVGLAAQRFVFGAPLWLGALAVGRAIVVCTTTGIRVRGQRRVWSRTLVQCFIGAPGGHVIVVSATACHSVCGGVDLVA